MLDRVEPRGRGSYEIACTCSNTETAPFTAKRSICSHSAEKAGTPLYVYSAGTIRDHYRRLSAAIEEMDYLVCYAVKANSNIAVLQLLAQEGAGFDIVSGGELFRVIRAGGDPGKCTFGGSRQDSR